MLRLLKHSSLSLVFSLPLYSSTKGHSQKLQIPRRQHNVHQNFFIVCPVPLWNSLSDATVQSKTVKASLGYCLTLMNLALPNKFPQEVQSHWILLLMEFKVTRPRLGSETGGICQNQIKEKHIIYFAI